MPSKRFLTFAVGVTLGTILPVPTAAFAQFPPPPPMAPAGPPPMPAAGPPAFAGPPQPGPRAGLGDPAPRLGPAAGPRADFTAARSIGGTPAVVNSARAASVNISRSGAYGYHVGGAQYSRRAAYAASAYITGAYAGYASSSVARATAIIPVVTANMSTGVIGAF